MVVTRRAPAPLPSSRTNSSQPIPRVAKSRAPGADVNAPDVSSHTTDRTTPESSRNYDQHKDKGNAVADSPKKNKTKIKGKQKKGKGPSDKKTGGFMDLLARVFLLWFTIYTLSVCPNDSGLNSPVCRGLHEYRRLVLEPYILPPIQHALAHPSIAPYVETVKPYADRAVTTAIPIALRAQAEWNRRIVPQWNARIVPQWNKRVVPQWNKRVVPLWEAYAAPRLQLVAGQIYPYTSQVLDKYEHYVGPTFRAMTSNLETWQRRARPYVILAAHKTYDSYQTAKPYAIPVWQKFRRLVRQLMILAAQQRRQFVDPHVKRIWEQVKELSNGKPKTESIRGAFSSPISEGSETVTSAVSSRISSQASIPYVTDVALGSTPSITLDTTSASEAAPVIAESTTASPSGQSLASTASVLDEDDASTLLSAVSASVSSVSAAVQYEKSPSMASSAQGTIYSILSAVRIPANDAEIFASSVASSAGDAITSSIAFLGDAATSVISQASGSVDEAASVASSTVVSATNKASIISSSLASSAPTTVQGDASHVPSSAASVTDTIMTVVSSVADTISIPLSSNADDDIDLDQFYAELGLDDEPLTELDGTASEAPAPIESESEEDKAERLRLKQLAVAEKRSNIMDRHTEWERRMTERMSANKKALRKALVALRKSAVADLKESKEIRREVEALVEEAEKYLKGADKYLHNLRKEARPDTERRTLWDRVVEKVNSKFAERLDQTEALVNGWYNGVLNQEVAEVKKVTDEIKDIADRAQADIGLDYAWLDDVTYDDWQRYHDLTRTSDNFTALAISIQDGSHPSPPVNPVLPALVDLQSEVQDIVVGFETRLRRVKRAGDRAFGQVDAEIDDSSSDETVSILPIEDAGNDEGLADIPSIVIGRSKEEVMAALDRVAESEGHATSSPQDLGKEPEEVVDDLVQEAEAQGDLGPTAAHAPGEL